MNSHFFVSWQPNFLHPQHQNLQPFNFGDVYLHPLTFGGIPPFAVTSFFRTQTNCNIGPYLMQAQKSQAENRELQRIEPEMEEKHLIGNSKKVNKKIGKRRRKHKNTQKQDRNVSSNLLKIFLKNLLDLRTWDCFITNLIQKSKHLTTAKRFHEWILSFKINYKNYIKLAQIKTLLSAQNSQDHQEIFRVVFLRFLRQEGLLHCLTARRIDKEASRRHIQRLREFKSLVS